MSRCILRFGAKPGEFEVIAGPRDVDLVRQAPGLRHDHRTGVWRGKAKWSTALILRAAFGEELDVDPAVYEWGQQVVSAENLAFHLKAGTYRPTLSTQAWSENLHDFQVDSVALMSEMEHVLNGDEMGAGKTVQAAVALKRLAFLSRESLPALIVCTTSMQDKWAEEVTKWVPGVEAVVVRGTAAKRRKILEDARAYAPGSPGDGIVLVMTWGALRTHTRLAGYGSIHLKRCVACDPRDGDPLLKEAACEVHPRELNGGWVRTVIADEAHKAKDPKAKQTRALWAVGQAATYRWPMTGTPVASNGEDLWALLHFVDPEAWPGKTAFVDRYLVSSSLSVVPPGVRVQPGDQARTGPPHGAVLHLPPQVRGARLAAAGGLLGAPGRDGAEAGQGVRLDGRPHARPLRGRHPRGAGPAGEVDTPASDRLRSADPGGGRGGRAPGRCAGRTVV
jgi:hypothetical protein